MSRIRNLLPSLAIVCAVAVAPVVTAGCTPSDASNKVRLRLGYLPNVTHAGALVGIEQGIFADAVGPDVDLQSWSFSAGPAIVEAVFGDAIDAAYIGPGPAINGFIRSHGDALRIVSGATSGGAFLIVRDGIDSSADLPGTRIASPQLGSTQDVALRTWLAGEGFHTDKVGRGEVTVVPQPNAATYETFRSGTIDGAWISEPWASRLVNEAGGHILLDERDLWEDGEFSATLLIVRKGFLDSHPAIVADLVGGHVQVNEFLNDQPEEVAASVIAGIATATGKTLPLELIEQSLSSMKFTNDPLVETVQQVASDMASLEFISGDKIEGIFDLSFLDAATADNGTP